MCAFCHLNGWQKKVSQSLLRWMYMYTAMYILEFRQVPISHFSRSFCPAFKIVLFISFGILGFQGNVCLHLVPCHSWCIAIVSLTSLTLNSPCGNFNWWGTVWDEMHIHHSFRVTNRGVSQHVIEYFKVYTIQINKHNGQSGVLIESQHLMYLQTWNYCLLSLSLMQYNLDVSTAYVSERSGCDQSTIMKSNFTHSHFLSELYSVSNLLTQGVILWWYLCEQSSSLWSCGHWTSILFFNWHTVKTASWWPSFSIKTSKVLVMGCAEHLQF